MVWVICIHVIMKFIDISLTSNACLSRQVHFHHFSFCNCINFGGMAVQCDILFFFLFLILNKQDGNIIGKFPTYGRS